MKKPSQAGHRSEIHARMRDAAQAVILEAAEGAFTEEGLDAPMEKIAARAGIAVGTIYKYFENRAALLDALTSARRQELLEAASHASARSAGRPFRERLLAVMQALSAGAQERLAFRRMLIQSEDAHAWVKRTPPGKMSEGVFLSLLEDGRKQGALAEDPLGLQLVFLASLLRAAFGVSLQEPERLPIERVPEVVAAQFLEGAGVKP